MTLGDSNASSRILGGGEWQRLLPVPALIIAPVVDGIRGESDIAMVFFQQDFESFVLC